MTDLKQFFQSFPDYGEILLLMFSSFLIGYFASYYLNRSTFHKIIKRLQQDFDNLKNENPDLNDIETIFTEIKPKIVEVVKQTRKNIDLEKQQPDSTGEKAHLEGIVERRRSQYIQYSQDKPKLNFDNIGYSSARDKNDLTQIEGIGPYIEQKLNEIGIYNFDQISKLKPSDIRLVTELIDFFPERIERDNWVGQAKNLKLQRH